MHRNYGIQKTKRSPLHLSTRGRVTSNFTTTRGGEAAVVQPSHPALSSSATKKAKTFPRPSDIPSVSDRVNVLEKQIKQVLNNTCNIVASLKRLESSLEDLNSVCTLRFKEPFSELFPSSGDDFSFSASPPPSATDKVISDLSSGYARHRNKALLNAANNRGQGSSECRNMSSNHRNSKKVLEKTEVHHRQKNTVTVADTVERWRRSRAKIGKQQKTHKRQAQAVLNENEVK